MNPDVAHAIPKLVESGALPPEKAPLLLRAARRELVSVHGELRLLLYLGVLLITGGVGLLVKENLDRIGPAAIAAAVGLAAAAALGWVARVSPPFSWREVRSPRLAFDYVLLLGVLLAAADLAYIEVQFTPLGPDWTWHLLIVAVFAGLARLPPALRHGSAAVLLVGLTGLYLAAHLGSFDVGALEILRRGFGDTGPASRSGPLRGLSIAATALVPLVYLAVGIRTRRHLFLLLGIGTGIASLVTLRAYVHLAPLWVLLTLSGAAVVAAVFALRRYLDSPPGKERGGFTAEPLFEDLARQRLLEAGAAAVSLTPEARPVEEEPRYAGGGGEFGGGGSSSEF